MNAPAKLDDLKVWTEPPAADSQPEPGYDEWLAEEIAEGIRQLDAGLGIPAEDVWKLFKR